MPSAKDYYKTLGVKRDASSDDIRKAYRRLARKYHPDLNPGDKTSEERFKEIQEANDILSDAKKRKMYDQVGFYSEQGFPGAGASPGQSGFGFGGFDFSDAAAGAGAGAQGGFGGAAVRSAICSASSLAARVRRARPRPPRRRVAIWSTHCRSISGSPSTAPRFASR